MLIIESIELENFCQHEHLRIEFPKNGRIGIFGPNGSGKSNLFQALWRSITGDFRGHPDGLAGWIRQNQDDNAFVELAGWIGGTSFRVRRDISKKTVTHRLWVDDQLIHGSTEIENWFRSKFHLSTQVVAEFLFVTQQDLFDFVRGTDGERSKKFAILCGTTELEKTREKFESIMKQDRTRYETANAVSLDVLLASLESARKNQAEIDTKLAYCREQIATSGGSADWEERSKELNDLAEKIQNWFTRLETTKTDRDQAVDRYETCRADRDRQNGLVTRQKEKKETIIQEGRAAKQALADLLNGRNEQELFEELNGIRQEIATFDTYKNTIVLLREKLQEMPVFVPVDLNEMMRLEEEWNTVVQEMNEAESRQEIVAELLAVHEQLGDDTEISTCRLCGADVEHWNINRASLQEEATALISNLSRMKQTRDSLKTELDTLTDRDKSFEENKRDREKIEQTILNAERQMAGMTCSNRDVESELAALEQARKAIQDALQRYRACDEHLTRELEILREKQKAFEEADQKKSRLDTDYQNLQPDRKAEQETVLQKLEERIQAITTTLASVREVEQQITSLEGARKESVRQQQQLEHQITEQRRLQETSGEMGGWFETFNRSIGWLRKDGIPRLIHRSVLNTLVDRINVELDRYDRPFTVTGNDDLTFTARFEDSRRINSRLLSKGQTVMLATSIWRAFNLTFHLGVMIFDEPSDGLDPENRHYFYDVIASQKTEKRQSPFQTVIISVDEEMAGTFDVVYRLGEGWERPPPSPRQTQDATFLSTVG